MKGIELPINILVIIAMAVMVLLGLVAIYMGGFGGGAGQIQLNSAKTDACQELIRSGKCGDASYTSNINVTGFDANKDGSLNPGTSGDNLQSLCIKWYGCTDTDNRAFVDCCHKKVCGCPV